MQQAPNNKYQIKNKSEVPNSNVQIALSARACFLEFVCDLGFGYWDLRFIP
jgi:hypothetical protein